MISKHVTYHTTLIPAHLSMPLSACKVTQREWRDRGREREVTAVTYKISYKRFPLV